MNRKQRTNRTRDNGSSATSSPISQPPLPRTTLKPFNIIPIHDLYTDHPSLRFPEVRAAAASLRVTDGLRKSPYREWREGMDLMDWLGSFFGFQNDNVRNQREHLVLHLANSQMRLEKSDSADSLDSAVLNSFRVKLLHNYNSWCSYMGRRPNVLLDRRADTTDKLRREILYVSLYLLIWGESANLRFVPECICYIFHHMSHELNKLLSNKLDDNTGREFIPSYFEDCAFLKLVVMPIYNTIQEEVKCSRNGTAPHSAWRNYDDINEYFWSQRCFHRLKWPFNLNSNFFCTTKEKRIGKTGFVEQRSFWNLFRSFDRLWVLLILFLQAAITVAWKGDEWHPWRALANRGVQVELLTVFITWAGLRFLQSILDVGTQYSLIRRETSWIGVRMAMKSAVAASWAIVFGVFYGRIWNQRNMDRRWSNQANQKIITFLEVVLVFVIPELLAIILFILPWIRNFIEQSDWRIFYFATWWFHTRIFIGRSLREGLVDNIKYSLFWILVLASKFLFSYFFQVRPLVSPTKSLLNLQHVSYQWHGVFNSNKVAVLLLWLPVILIYFMDLQIWYCIFSSFVGAVIGLFSHIGEIRNTHQLRLRFQFFAGALQFNLIPEERFSRLDMTLLKKLFDAIQRLKLRYGLGQPYKKMESSQVDATRFALIWNEIILSLREEDLISNRELELLELSENCWNIRVIRWPCLLLCKELVLALSQASELATESDNLIWSKICKSEYRRCAVIEVYDSIKYMLHEIVKRDTKEENIIIHLFSEIENYINIGKITETYNMKILQQIHNKLMVLVDHMIRPQIDMNKVVNILQALYELSVRELPKMKKSINQLREEGLVPFSSSNDVDLLFENAIVFPDARNIFFFKQLRRLRTILDLGDSMQNIPVNLEARRRIAFFSNSLFMNLPRAPKVEKMMAFSVLTPYYDEEVLYGKEMLRSENEDGISTLFYLQRIYEDEWQNFVERMHGERMENDDGDDIFETNTRDIRMWASYRGQTLSRTVRGMMYYYRALKMLSFLDSASEVDIKPGSQVLASQGSLNWSTRGVSHLLSEHENGEALMKFTYVIACQLYGQDKAKDNPHAKEILRLMEKNVALRVAYVDKVVFGGEEEDRYYSVLVKFDQQVKKEVEIYRIRLPGPLKIGEGKPENQNHAIIFTRGDAVQTIDMNQDNYFEEALKIRNLLEEFNMHYGIRRPTILGLRENIFTGSVSSLAWFMSAQEASFVTLGQRVLANPLKVRMHYGHPDVFDRFWFLTRGGVSKASRLINLSEDIYAGFNCMLRGGNVTHHEYMQVGKGKDVGLNQISNFEAKVSSGNGEQVLSRDVYRLGHRLDFFRMLSFFYTTVGFYFNTMLVILTVYAFLWGRLYLALSGIEKAARHNVVNNKALGAVLNQQFIVQIGLFTALPMVVENCLEQGFVQAIWDFFMMQLQLASLFYTFSMGTRTHFFGRTILHGGAKYRATGRGFVVQHKKFAENYRLYARSHFVKAIELGVILIVYAFHSPVAMDTFVYIAMSISCWFLVFSWMMSPFVFNPSGFDWLKTVYDFDDFMSWIWYRGDGVLGRSEQSWETWWYEEHDHLRTTGLWGKLLELILNTRFFFFQYGIVYQLHITGGRTGIGIYLLSWISIIAFAAISLTIAYAQNNYAAKQHIYYRLVQLFVISITVLVIVLLLELTTLEFLDLIKSVLAFIPTGWGLICMAQVLRPFLQFTAVWETVVSLARLYEMLFGIIVMAPMALFSWLPGFQSMQTRILFNEAFSRGLQISRILTGKRSHVDT